MAEKKLENVMKNLKDNKIKKKNLFDKKKFFF